MTHPSDTAGAVERIRDALEAPRLRAGNTVVTITSEDASYLLSLNATLQGRVDLAVGALEEIAEPTEPMSGAMARIQFRAVGQIARDTLSKIKALGSPTPSEAEG